MKLGTAGAVGAVVAVQVAVLTALSGRYGFHRDELYFLAASHHLAWGYIDQPPITPLLAKVATALFGDTPAGLRVIPTLLGAATVIVVALFARELGGGRRAQVFAAAATALGSFVLVVSHMLSTTTIDLLVWTVLGLLTVRLLRTGDGRWWVPIGVVVGIAMENKWLLPLLLCALGIAVLAVGPRDVFRTWWLALGAILALALLAPGAIWQAMHHFPLLTVANEISQNDGTQNRILFIPMQMLYLSPVLVPVWVAGFIRLWRTPRLRAFALAYPVLCVELLILGGKPYYGLPLLILLTAAGAEPTLASLENRHVLRLAAGAAAVVGAAISVVVGLPVLPVAATTVLAVNKEAGEQAGWPEFVSTVGHAWQRIPAAQRATAVIFTNNYGQAGAIERFGTDMPAPYSGHMSYADWGPPPDAMTGPIVVAGRTPGVFSGCHPVATNSTGIGNDEDGTQISLCTETSAPWSQIWPLLRHA